MLRNATRGWTLLGLPLFCKNHVLVESPPPRPPCTSRPQGLLMFLWCIKGSPTPSLGENRIWVLCIQSYDSWYHSFGVFLSRLDEYAAPPSPPLLLDVFLLLYLPPPLSHQHYPSIWLVRETFFCCICRRLFPVKTLHRYDLCVNVLNLRQICVLSILAAHIQRLPTYTCQSNDVTNLCVPLPTRWFSRNIILNKLVPNGSYRIFNIATQNIVQFSTKLTSISPPTPLPCRYTRLTMNAMIWSCYVCFVEIVYLYSFVLCISSNP